MGAVAALSGIGAAFGLASSAGLNAYIPLLVVALASRLPLDAPLLQLSEPYDILGRWWVIGLLIILLLIEMLVDKIPAVDSVNDVIQTFIRPTAGALLFAANARVITDISPALALIAGLLLAGGVHVTKGTVRPIVTASTVGTGNWAVSLAEDVAATATSVLALVAPILIGTLVILILAGVTWWLWRWRQRRGRRQVGG